ncbi:MAG TPA: methylated-DNA--[protein]-cysteine S-methyltransferase [Verrucomicrobiae bacterium]|nr:methylated-DNA--[protein]-cysteine S-methyltransferase [Verrucomicrobiae bacterium]
MAALEGLCRPSFMVNVGEKLMTTCYSIIKTSVGELVLAANQTELTGVYFYDSRHVPAALKTWTLDDKNPVLKRAAKEINEYLDGKRTGFTFPTAALGTDFQKKVWKEIAKIPYGKTVSYSDLAKRAGSPNAIRAAGAATGKNPMSIIVPCHRVVGKNNAITGYAGGLERKRRLLELETSVFRSR